MDRTPFKEKPLFDVQVTPCNSSNNKRQALSPLDTDDKLKKKRAMTGNRLVSHNGFSYPGTKPASRAKALRAQTGKVCKEMLVKMMCFREACQNFILKEKRELKVELFLVDPRPCRKDTRILYFYCTTPLNVLKIGYVKETDTIEELDLIDYICCSPYLFHFVTTGKVAECAKELRLEKWVDKENLVWEEFQTKHNALLCVLRTTHQVWSKATNPKGDAEVETARHSYIADWSREIVDTSHSLSLRMKQELDGILTELDDASKDWIQGSRNIFGLLSPGARLLDKCPTVKALLQPLFTSSRDDTETVACKFSRVLWNLVRRIGNSKEFCFLSSFLGILVKSSRKPFAAHYLKWVGHGTSWDPIKSKISQLQPPLLGGFKAQPESGRMIMTSDNVEVTGRRGKRKAQGTENGLQQYTAFFVQNVGGEDVGTDREVEFYEDYKRES